MTAQRSAASACVRKWTGRPALSLRGATSFSLGMSAPPWAALSHGRDPKSPGRK
jgi:hypothetical protein